MATSTISQPRSVSITAVILGAVGTLLVVGLLSLSYFRPNDAYAVQGASTTYCGSPDLLLNQTSGPGTASFDGPGTITKAILSCSSPFGGTTQNITLRILRNSPDTKASYSIYLDGSSSPVLTFAPDMNPASQKLLIAGWQIDKEFISTTIPIKFNSTLAIYATVNKKESTDVPLVSGHVQFIPEAQEVPVKFLNVPLINVNGPIHSIIDNQVRTIIDGQPIQVRDQH